MGKYIIAVDEDIDPSDFGSIVWALSFRTQPAKDVQIIGNKLPRLDPSMPVPPGQAATASASAMLIDATRPADYPPTSLPTEEHMTAALAMWQRLGLPELTIAEPLYGYELGDWTEENREEALLATLGRYLETGAKLHER
jgi:4-hydroxy-3-polyprenylbenzoate decarboxylase